ncbi:phosphate ABC transporter permease subunit PstC [Pelagibacterales bacterium SAG-MED31]|nr:phosphate ABC transporter permease subunit PstC [Pelagibacterales bacterium SAG-MED31]
MFYWSLIIILLGIYSAYIFGKSRITSNSRQLEIKTASLPTYYAQYIMVWCLLPALIVYFGWIIFEDQIIQNLVLANFDFDLNPALNASLLIAEIKNVALSDSFAEGKAIEILNAAEHYASIKYVSSISFYLSILIVMILGVMFASRKLQPSFRAQQSIENYVKYFLFFCSSVAVLTTVGIVFSLLFESLRFFSDVSVFEFLFGTKWYPYIPIREGQSGSQGSFGAVPIFAGTFLIMIVAMCVATPIGLFTAIYLAEYASPRVRRIIKPLLEILAGVPTIVYGFFAFVTVAPFVKTFGQSIGIDASPTSALAAGLVMGIMIIPFISSLSDDVINSVPQSLREGSLGIGANKAETIKRVILPAALPGIVGAFLLGVSRAIGETMIVVVAAGTAPNLTANPFENVTTVTVQIVIALIGDQEFDDPRTLSAFALGLVLFVITLILNIFALRIVKKYRERYE